MSPHAYEYRGTLLKLDDVSLTLGGNKILRNVNLEIKDLHRPGMTQGQVVALLGPSGVGKTCLFRILAGLDKPDSGQVLVEEEQVPVQRGMVGVIAQNYPLFAHRTVRGNLVVAGKQARLPGAEIAKRATEILARFGLEDHGNKYPAQLSGGQRQRVAIAQQFMCSEHFLLMDEPFSGLDMVAVDRVIGFIREMAASDELKTFILVTHDVDAALRVADTIWLLGRDRDDQGKIVPGAYVQATYNLADCGLAWRDEPENMPEFAELRREVCAAFRKL
ncbi:MAG: sulfate-transporting ATPase [Capsulimonas sp.]|jgi:NitT/TauT family transport system ATP-binding protein|nr:sulfate-transporting ATPase [Capsulimonas sp.]